MRTLNQDDDRPVKSVLIMLTPSEAKELVDKVNQLTPEKGDHLHVNDESFLREVTIGIYTPENMDSFHPRVIDLIEKEI